jgi:hypothetical protein
VDGYHGIFITAREAFSGVLPRPSDVSDWQLRERAGYAGLAQMGIGWRR